MSRPVTPASGAIRSRPVSAHGQDTMPGIANVDHVQGTPQDTSYLSGGLNQDGSPGLQRSNSQMSQSDTFVPSRGGTLKKKASLKRNTSLKRSGSKKSSYAGSVRSLRVGEKEKYEPEEYNSAFYCPIPTTGSPTELLANRFQAWRKVLKDIITYFRDLHKSHESRSKSLLSASNVINAVSIPSDFLQSGGIGEAARILRDFHKQAITEAQKARDLENDVIMQLTGLRSDLSQKIKEIKSLSGDFKNHVGREQNETQKAVNHFQEALGTIDHDASATAGKGDPFLIKMGVERQLERQLEEENYLHRAYLNLEASGRELESIVVGEIQKAYNVLAGILRRDADSAYDTAEKMREGPLAMAKDHEWDSFVTDNKYMVDPRQPLRQVKQITYHGKDHPAAIEVKSGMLERKSKYLKNYTPGWYILSPTHLHEFKSADRIAFQQPIMSLYLPEQKLGSHSDPGSSSHKFMLKGRQTGSMHRGHTWIFRAETYDTMMAWFSDVKELTEKRGAARDEFVRRTHARSISAGSVRAASVASGESQMEEDEADKIAFSSEQSVRGLPSGDQAETTPEAGVGAATGAATGLAAATDDTRSEAGWRPPPQRPQPGGRFPSEVNVNRGLQTPLSPSSGDSDGEHDRDIAQANALPGAIPVMAAVGSTESHANSATHQPKNESAGAAAVPSNIDSTAYTAGEHPNVHAQPTGAEVANDTQSRYNEWVDTMEGGEGTANTAIALGAGTAGAGVGAGIYGARQYEERRQGEHARQIPDNEDVSTSVTQSSTAQQSAPSGTKDTPPTHAPIQSKSTALAEDSIHNQVTGMHSNNTITDTSTSSTYATNPAANQFVTNGGLISGTDIRSAAASGPAPNYSSAGPGPKDSVASVSTSVAGEMQDTIGDLNEPSGFDIAGTGTDLSDRTRPDNTRGASYKSVQTISDLHIPGEFPRTGSASSSRANTRPPSLSGPPTRSGPSAASGTISGATTATGL